MIGHLQTNKVNKALPMFDMIQSVDSLRLCRKLHEWFQAQARIGQILIEVNTSNENTKYGLAVNEVVPFLEKIQECDSLRVRGLMTMAAFNNDCQQARESFCALRLLRDQINEAKKQHTMDHVSMEYLSMGMSSDFEAAVQEGANMVRIGSALFQEEA